jgi:TolB protein
MRWPRRAASLDSSIDERSETMKRMRIAAGAVVAAALTATAAWATAPGPNGLIVYQATVGKHVQLFTVRPDGGGVRQLTHFADGDAVHASWSPDGAAIAFERDFGKSAGIYTMSPDGTNVRPLTSKGLQGLPAYSPDGETIVFDRALAHEDALWLMNADGSGLRQLTRNRSADNSPVFSPDGSKVAFVREATAFQSAAFVVNLDGSGLKQLTSWHFNISSKLDWSPDGSRIVISSPQTDRPGPSNVYTIRPDGTGLMELTHETKPGVRDLADGFSPDGKKIIFARTVDGGPFQVYVMNANGTGIKQLTRGVDAHWASWGRQG